MAARQAFARSICTLIRNEAHQGGGIVRGFGAPCLAECNSSASMPPAVGQQRGFADNSASPSDHAKAKQDFQRSMTDLRRQWYEQGKTRAVARAEKREQAFRRQEAFVQRAKQLRELRQGAQQAKYAKQQKRLLAEKAALKETNAQWRTARDNIYAKLHHSRRKQLIEQSRTWITADTLEARIGHALDNPIPLSGIVLPSEEQTDAPKAQSSSNGL
ncbi:g11971 [Coccomyxa viridis]|uniref:G11971 protein n=1 Tax=Coccomyxa viridis TaxID=1274662 RepID=A0ABP1G989_9CHLO